MPTRRLALAALIATLAIPAFAQGKKSSAGSGDDMAKAIAGTYTSTGLNADGSAYNGVADITEAGSAVTFKWVVAGDTMNGSGTREGRVVTVDWGASTPVIYVVMPDGSLHGTWDDGKALEKLTPR